MNRLMIAVAVILVAGCAYTPKEFREQGARSTFDLEQPPDRAVVCMMRNLQERPGLEPHALPIDGGQEVLVRIAGTGLYAMISDVMAAVTGSRATVWVSPNPMVGKDELPKLMTKGC